MDDTTEDESSENISKPDFNQLLKVSNNDFNVKDFFRTKEDIRAKVNKRDVLCEYCPKRFRYKNMESHINSVHLKIKPYKCPFCTSECSSKYNIRSHLNSCHFKQVYYFCRFKTCTFGSIDPEIVRKHELTHYEERRKEGFKWKDRKPIHSCRMCRYSTKYKNLIKSHLTNNHICIECCLTFCDPKQHAEHKTTVHSNKVKESENQIKAKRNYIQRSKHSSIRNGKTYKCNICDYSTTVKQLLRTHISRNHRYRCSKCSRKFDDINELEVHQKEKHSEQKTYECHLCPYYSKSSAVLRVHMRTHTGEKPYECSICGRRFSNDTTRNRHEDYTHNRVPPMMCEWPGCEAMIKGGIRKMRVHHLTHSTQKKYTCVWPGCDQKFKSALYLKLHMTVHSDERKYECNWPQCESKFKRAPDLKKHMKIHINNRALKCPVEGCNRVFIDHSNRNRHLKTHRNDKQNHSSQDISK